MQWAQQQHLTMSVVMFFGDREASFKGRPRCFTMRAREHQGRSQAGLKAHLLDTAAHGIVKIKNCPLGPAVTFRKERHRQKHRYSSGGKSSADCNISAAAKTPFQRHAHISKTGKVERSLRPARQSQPLGPDLLQPSPVII